MGNIKGTKRGSYKKNNLIDTETESVQTESAPIEVAPIESAPIETVQTESAPIEVAPIESAPIETVQSFDNEINPSAEFDNWKNDYSKITDTEAIENAKKRIEQGLKNKTPEIVKSKKQQKNEDVIKDASAQLMNGAMIFTFCDFFFPTVLKLIYTRFLKNDSAKKVRHKDVILSSEQRQSLNEVGDAMAQEIFKHINPVLLGMIAMLTMYGVNFKCALDNIEADIKK